MGKIDKLIQQYCPNGVEYVPLGDVVQVCRGTRVVKSQLSNSGFPVYQNCLTPMGCFDKTNCKAGTTFVICGGAAGNVGYTDVDCWAADDCEYIKTEHQISNRYIYYCLMSNQHYLLSKVRKASIPRLSPSVIKQLQIPYPPLPIQEEIVRILDTFTELEAELEAELQARQQQYAYYKRILFSKDYPTMKIGDITRVFSASRVHKNEWKTSGVPFYRSSDVISFHRGEKNSRGDVFISEELFEKLSAKSGKIRIGDLLVTGGGTIGVPYIVQFEPLYVKDADLLCIVKNDILDNRFLYHYMKSEQFHDYLSSITHDATIAHYTISQIKETPVPVPSWEEQQRLIDILDRFDTLVNDLSQGLPAEIEARKQQYEYYRDKLLTFKKKA